jgi:predicted alpha/beta hydrolase family esterase
MIKKKVIFVHGYGEYIEDFWPNWLEREFVKYGFDFLYFKMPDPMYPQVDQWLAHLQSNNLEINTETYFIGHSLGCITIARYLSSLSSGKVAGACIFVSGFCTMPNIPLLSDFCTKPLDYSKVKKHAKEFIVIFSDDDHIVPPRFSQELAEKLDARIIKEEGKGHYRTNIKKAPCILNVILEIDQMKAEKRELSYLRRIKDN